MAKWAVKGKKWMDGCTWTWHLDGVLVSCSPSNIQLDDSKLNIKKMVHLWVLGSHHPCHWRNILNEGKHAKGIN